MILLIVNSCLIHNIIAAFSQPTPIPNVPSSRSPLSRWLRYVFIAHFVRSNIVFKGGGTVARRSAPRYYYVIYVVLLEF